MGRYQRCLSLDYRALQVGSGVKLILSFESRGRLSTKNCQARPGGLGGSGEKGRLVACRREMEVRGWSIPRIDQ